MKITLKKTVSLLLSASFLLMTGCAGQNQPPTQAPTDENLPTTSIPGTAPPAGQGSAAAFELANLNDAKALPAYDYSAPSDNAKKVAAALNAFAFKMSAGLASEEENLVVSPLSVAFTLAALANATQGDAQAQLIAAMGLEGMSMEDVNDGFARLLYQLCNEGDEYDNGHKPLAIANAVFVDSKATLNTDFAQAILDSLRANAISVDFSSQEAIDAINAWCDEHTEGMIPKIIELFDDPDSIAAVLNAIYFSDRWINEFSPDDTKDDTFRGVSGNTTVPMMEKTDDQMVYFEDDTMQAINLPFMTGGGLMVLLPKEGSAADLLSGMDAASFEALQSSMESKSGTLKLPKFKIEYNTPLSDVLSQMGFESLFDKSNPVLTKLIEENDAYISQSIHKAVIEVDEKGTTAAAVTAMIAGTTSAMLPTEPFEMTCDKPFVFILYRRTVEGGNMVIFSGVVNNIAP